MMKNATFFVCIFFGLTWINLFYTDAGADVGPSVWTDLGLSAGYVQTLAVSPQHAETIFAGIYMGEGLFRTTDGAATWHPLTMAHRIAGEDTFENQSLTAVAVAPTNSQVVWAAHNQWVAKSTDGGSTWTHIRNDTMQKHCRNCSGSDADRFRFCQSITIDPHDADVVYVGTAGPWGTYTSGALFRTTDGGSSWEKLNGGIDVDYTVMAVSLSPRQPGVIWIATSLYGAGGVWDGTVYRSTDNGDRFFSPDPKPINGSSLAGLTCHPEEPDVVFAAGGIGVVRITIQGTNWLSELVVEGSGMAAPVAFTPGDANVAYAGWNRPASLGGDGLPKLSRSRDGGHTWETRTLNQTLLSTPGALAVDPGHAETLYWGDRGGGVMKSEDGGQTWTPVNQGLNGVMVNDVDTDPGNSAHLIAATTGGVYERMDGRWYKRLNRNASSVRFDPNDSTTYYAGLYSTLVKTIDGGQTFSYNTDSANNTISHIEIDPTNPQRLFITDGSLVRRSLDGGDTFTALLEGINSSGQSHMMNVVTIDPGNPQRVLAGGGNFLSPLVAGGLWQSLDGGETWQATGLFDVIVNDVQINPGNPDILFAGCGYSSNVSPPLYKSVDGGDNWEASIQGFPLEAIGLNAVWAGEGGEIFAVGFGGQILHVQGGRVGALDTGTREQLYDVFGMDASTVFAVGDKGTLLRFDGTGWTPMASPVDTTLYGIWGTSEHSLYAVGAGGRVLRYTDGQWTIMTPAVSTTLHDIFGTSEDNILAVGGEGTIVHYDGHQWTPMTSSTTNDLYNIRYAGDGRWYAAGEKGTILTFDGIAWSTMASGTDERIYGFWSLASNDIYAVTSISGDLLHFDGSQWHMTATPHDYFSGIRGGPDNRLYVVNGSGGIFSFDGSQWNTLRPAGSRFRSVTDLEFHRNDPDIVYAATLKAGVYISPNQGAQWLNLGTPRMQVNAIATGSLYAATNGGLHQLTGTGVMAGRVSDINDDSAINGAAVATSMGHRDQSILGDYMVVVPAGIFDIYATADGYQMDFAQGLTVVGSDVTWHNFKMTPGASVDVADISVNGTTTSNGSHNGGSYCFISTFENTVPLKRIVIVLLIGLALFGILALGSGLRGKKSKPSTALRLLFFCAIFLSLTCTLPEFGANAATLFQQVDIASSPVPVGSGARAMGMGGAFIALADDATAASWNPAGLIELQEPEISVVGTYDYRSLDFDSGRHPESNGSHSDDYTSLNYFSATLPVSWFKSMVFSINYQRLYDFERSFRRQIDYAQKGLDLKEQSVFDQNGHIGAVGLAGAIELTPHLSLGGTLNVWTDELGWDNGWTGHYRAQATGSQAGVPVTVDTTITDTYEKFRGINFNLGILWETDDWGRFGAVVKTPFTATVVHRNRFRQTTIYGPPMNTMTETGPISVDEDVELEMPLSYGLGWTRRVTENISLALDLSRVHWDHYTLTDSQGNVFSPIDGQLEAQSSIDPTLHVRFGFEYVVRDQKRQFAIPLRAGLFYDPEPGQGGSRDFFGISLGSGLSRKRFSLDAAYQLRWGQGVDTSNLISNSTADVMQHTFMASVIYYF